jgi:uncharacterized protein (DUF2252 family)
LSRATLEQREANGKAARGQASRSSPGKWAPAPDRPDPIALIEAQSASRIPELVPVRYKRMEASALAYFEGTAAVMAADLAHAPRTGLTVQLFGDAHLGNFGIFAAPDRRLVFGADDFDETLPGPFEWDVERLAASFEIAARDSGFGPGERREIVLRVADSYRGAMHDMAAKSTLDVWYARLEADEITERWGREVSRGPQRHAVERDIARGDVAGRIRELDRLVKTVDGAPRFASDPPFLVPIDDFGSIARVLDSYRSSLPDDRQALLARFDLLDAARKVVGVGSVGTRVWVLLLEGRDAGDLLMLQLKEADASVLEPYLGASTLGHHGRRVADGQRLTQAATDIMLGWTSAEDVDGSGESRDYYVRQLWDGKAHTAIEAMSEPTMGVYAEVCGWSLAHGHARSGDPVAIAAYLGRSDAFDESIAGFAAAYADRNDADYAEFKRAIAHGRLPAS